VLASILLTPELNLTYQYSADETDLENYLQRIKGVFQNKNAKLGDRHRRKTKYRHKRKSKG
jgi:type II secretory pathway component PulJ